MPKHPSLERLERVAFVTVHYEGATARLSGLGQIQAGWLLSRALDFLGVGIWIPNEGKTKDLVVVTDEIPAHFEVAAMVIIYLHGQCNMQSLAPYWNGGQAWCDWREQRFLTALDGAKYAVITSNDSRKVLSLLGCDTEPIREPDSLPSSSINGEVVLVDCNVGEAHLFKALLQDRR